MKNSFFFKVCALFICMIMLAVNVAADDTASESVDLEQMFRAKSFTSDDGFTMKYRLYVPDNYDSSRAYPCLLFMHGSGERGNDNEAQIKVGLPCMFTDPDSPVYESIIIAPQCPEGDSWVYDFSVDSVAMKTTLEILETVCSTYSVNRNRVYVTGISMGGHGTWDALSRHSELFAAGMPLCGIGDPSYADILATKPIRIFHDSNDTLVPVQGSSAMYRAIKNVADPDNVLVSFHMTTGYGHFIWDHVYSDRKNIDWLYSVNADLEPVVKMSTTETEQSGTAIIRHNRFTPMSIYFWASRFVRAITANNK